MWAETGVGGGAGEGGAGSRVSDRVQHLSRGKPEGAGQPLPSVAVWEGPVPLACGPFSRFHSVVSPCLFASDHHASLWGPCGDTELRMIQDDPTIRVFNLSPSAGSLLPQKVTGPQHLGLLWWESLEQSVGCLDTPLFIKQSLRLPEMGWGVGKGLTTHVWGPTCGCPDLCKCQARTELTCHLNTKEPGQLAS